MTRRVNPTISVARKKEIKKLICSFLPNFHYKPNWKFSYSTYKGYPLIKFQFQVQNSNAAHKEPMELYIRVHVDPRLKTEKTLLKFMYEHILMIEIHEVEEWIRYKKTRPFDPHKRIQQPLIDAGFNPPPLDEDTYFSETAQAL